MSKEVYFEKVSPYKYEHLRNDQYFDFNKGQILFPNTGLGFFKIKKGVGKTTQFIKDMERIDKIKDCKIAFGRWSRTEMNNLAGEGNSSNLFPFRIYKGNIYSKKTKEHKGNIFYIKGSGLNGYASLQFEHYSEVYVDEFVPKDDNYDNAKKTVRKFMYYLLDVQRNKPDLTVKLYGNNNDLFDPFSQTFNIDVRSEVEYDKDGKVLFANLTNFYKPPIINAKAYGFIKYDEEAKNYLEENDSGQMVDDIINSREVQKFIVDFQLVGHNNNYIFYKTDKYKGYRIIDKVDYINLDYPCYTPRYEDMHIDPNIIYIKSDNTIGNGLFLLFKNRKLGYTNKENRDAMIRLIPTQYKIGQGTDEQRKFI